MVLITIVTGAKLNQLITVGGHIVGFSWRFPKSWWYPQVSSKSLDHVSIETDGNGRHLHVPRSLKALI